MWRACSNILPTKYQLRARGIGRDDKCDLCGGCETFGHILWECKMAGAVRGNTRLKLPSLEVTPRDFVDIVWEIMSRRPEIDWELFTVTAWSLWNNRNLVHHGGKSKSSELIVREVAAYMTEVRQTKEAQTRPAHPIRQIWTPPKRGFYKINIDEAVFQEMGCCGVGVIIRNEDGQLMSAMSKRFYLPLKTLEVEAKAVKEGITLARELSLKNIIVESDAQVVVNSLSESGLLPSSILTVIEGTRMSLRGFDSWEINHICRAKNSAAHLMAKHAKFVFDYNVWVEDTPPAIEKQILYDVSLMNDISV